jgi:hypothetical protein
VADDQPFTVVENEEFCEIIKYLWSDANIPTADTIRNDLNTYFIKAKTQVKDILQVNNYYINEILYLNENLLLIFIIN